MANRIGQAYLNGYRVGIGQDKEAPDPGPSPEELALNEEATSIAQFFVALKPDLRDKVIEFVQDRMCIHCGTEYEDGRFMMDCYCRHDD